MSIELLSVSRDRWVPCFSGHCKGTVVYVELLNKLPDSETIDISTDGSQAIGELSNKKIVCLRVDIPIVTGCRPVSSPEAPLNRLSDETLCISERFAEAALEAIRKDLVQAENDVETSVHFLALADSRTETVSVGDIFIFRPVGVLAVDRILFTSGIPVSILDHKNFLLEILCTPPGKDQVTLLFTKWFTHWGKLMVDIERQITATNINHTESGHLLDVVRLVDFLLRTLHASSQVCAEKLLVSDIRRLASRCTPRDTNQQDALFNLKSFVDRYDHESISPEHPFIQSVTTSPLNEQSTTPGTFLSKELAKYQETCSIPFDVVGVSESGEFLIRKAHRSQNSIFAVAISQVNSRISTSTSGKLWSLFWFQSFNHERGLMELQSTNFSSFITLLQAVVVSLMIHNAQNHAEGAEGPSIRCGYDFHCFEVNDEKILLQLVSCGEAPENNKKGLLKQSAMTCSDSTGNMCEFRSRESISLPDKTGSEGQLSTSSLEERIVQKLAEPLTVHFTSDVQQKAHFMATRLVQRAHSRRKGLGVSSLAPIVQVIQQTKQAQRDLIAKLAVNECEKSITECSSALLSVYDAFITSLETIRKRRSSLSFLIISDRMNLLDQHSRRLGECQLQGIPLASVSSGASCMPSSMTEQCIHSLCRHRSKLWRLLETIEKDIWKCSIALDEFIAAESEPGCRPIPPMESFLACGGEGCISPDSLFASQEELDVWLYRESVIERGKDLSQDVDGTPPLFRIPSRPDGSVQKPPAFPGTNAPDAERRLFARECVKYHVHCLQELYFNLVDIIRNLKGVERELCVQWSAVDAVTKQTVHIASLSDLFKQDVREALYRQYHSLVIIDAENTDAVSRMRELLFRHASADRCAVLSISPDRSKIPPCDVLIGFPEKHSTTQGIVDFLSSLTAQYHNEEIRSEEDNRQIVEKSGLGIDRDAFIWTTPSCDVQTLWNMAIRLARYVVAAQPGWTVRLVVSDYLLQTPFGQQMVASDSFTMKAGRIELVQYSQCNPSLVDAHIFLFGESDAIEGPDLVKFVRNSQFAFYAIAGSKWYRRVIESKYDSSENRLGGPGLRIACTKGHTLATREVFVDFQRRTDLSASTKYKPNVNFPDFNSWCPLMCLRQFDGCPLPGSHLCQRKCAECPGDHTKCPYPCPVVFACGHFCLNACGEPCGTCQEPIIIESSCQGSQAIDGYDNATKAILFNRVSHYREGICCEVVDLTQRRCVETVTKPCLRCGEDISGLPCGAEPPKQCHHCSNQSSRVRNLLRQRSDLKRRRIALSRELCKQQDTSQKARCCERAKAEEWQTKQMELADGLERRAKERSEKEVQDRKILISFLKNAKASLTRSNQLTQSYLKLSYPEKCEDIELHGL